MDVGFIGLGAMGRLMSQNLADAGHRVIAWNRSPVEAPAGVTLEQSPEDVAAAASATFVMVSDEAAVRDVVLGAQGVVRGASDGHRVIQCSTIGADATRKLAADLAPQGIRLLDAPVSGSVPAAKSGGLTVLGGGDEEDFAECAPLFEAIAARTVLFGSVGSGSAVKLTVNTVLITTLAAAAEAVTWLADTEPEVAIDALPGVLERISPLVAQRSPALLGPPAENGFPIGHVAKDMALIDAGMPNGVVAPAVAALCRDAVTAGLAEWDITALGAHIRSSRGGG